MCFRTRERERGGVRVRERERIKGRSMYINVGIELIAVHEVTERLFFGKEKESSLRSTYSLFHLFLIRKFGRDSMTYVENTNLTFFFFFLSLYFLSLFERRRNDVTVGKVKFKSNGVVTFENHVRYCCCCWKVIRVKLKET